MIDSKVQTPRHADKSGVSCAKKDEFDFRQVCDFSRRLKPYELPNLAIRKLTAPRHLSRYTAATMYPRQPDNLTVNFFPRTSFGTNVLENTHDDNTGVGKPRSFSSQRNYDTSGFNRSED